MTNPSPRRAALIVNAKSRKGQKLFKKARRLLKESSVELAMCKAVRDPKNLDGEVKRAVAEGIPLVIVGGGDGSISCSVDHVVGSDTVFALLPLGTANSFARTLGIPLTVEGAVEVIATGRAKQIDLGMIDDDYFANCAAIGISPLIAETVPHGLKKMAGAPRLPIMGGVADGALSSRSRSPSTTDRRPRACARSRCASPTAAIMAAPNWSTPKSIRARS